MVSAIKYWLFGLVWTSVLLFLSIYSVPGPESDIVVGIDKVMHAAAYAGLAALFIRACEFTFRGRRRILTFSLVLIGSIALGGLTEYMQSFTFDRSPEFGDLLADAFGVVLALALYFWAIPSHSVVKDWIYEETT